MERKSFSAIDSIFEGCLNVSFWVLSWLFLLILLQCQLRDNFLFPDPQLSVWFRAHHGNINVVFATAKLDCSTCLLKKQHFVELENTFLWHHFFSFALLFFPRLHCVYNNNTHLRTCLVNKKTLRKSGNLARFVKIPQNPPKVPIASFQILQNSPRHNLGVQCH